jgi:hypothetical protein
MYDVGEGDMNWIVLAQKRGKTRGVLNAVMNIRVPLNGVNFLTG